MESKKPVLLITMSLSVLSIIKIPPTEYADWQEICAPYKKHERSGYISTDHVTGEYREHGYYKARSEKHTMNPE